MSLAEHKDAILLHRDFVLKPKYPYMLNKLNFAYDKAQPSVEEIRKMELPGLLEVILPKTIGSRDGYEWKCVLWFPAEIEQPIEGVGSVYIALPHRRDRSREDNVSLDRSIALYVWDDYVQKKAIEKIVNNLMLSLAKLRKG